MGMEGSVLFFRRLTALGVGVVLAVIAPAALLNPASAAITRNARVSPSSQHNAWVALSASPSSWPLLAGAGATTTAGALMINGGTFQSPAYGSTFVLTGTAPVGDTVSLHFHKAGTPANDYSIVRTVAADDTGFWLRPITANIAYRYYATDGTLTSANVLNAPTPTVKSPLRALAALGSTYTLTGGAPPNSVVYVHFHAAGSPASDYSIVRSVNVDDTGAWARPYLVIQDYRFFTSPTDSNDADYAKYLVQVG